MPLFLFYYEDSKQVLRHTANKLKEALYLDYTFEDKNIALVPIGGCGNLKHWTTQRIAEQFSIPWGILLDSDKGTEEENQNTSEIQKLRNKGIKAYTTRKREPENYIDIGCIREEVFSEPFSDTEDVKDKINLALNCNNKLNYSFTP